jgi:hypothetical protein
MNKFAALIAVPLLSGCITIGSKPNFPEAPAPLLTKCEELETINKPAVLLSEMMKTVARNYSKYHECSAQIEAWQDWYAKQRKNTLGK